MKIAAALVAVAALSSFIPAPLAAQDYPARPVKVIVPGPAGGGLDVVARAVIQRLADSGRGQFFVENLPREPAGRSGPPLPPARRRTDTLC
jgi:tripartite-type tricarboxylate transporter receptor subunit TctC